MARSTVEVIVSAAKAITPLRRIEQASKKTQAALGELEKRGRALDPRFRRTGAAANTLAASITRLAGAYAGFRLAQQAVQTGIRREESERRLKFLARSYQEVDAAQRLAIESGRKFGLSITESNRAFAQLYGRLRPLGISLQDINTAFIGFNTAAKVSGATAQESAGALLQLTQALGSGVLRGQELNSVLEQAPGLVVALTKELDVPISKIRKLAQEGKITSEVVIRALQRAGEEGADQLAEAMNGPAQKIKDFQNAAEEVQVALTETIIPQLTDSFTELADIILALEGPIKYIGGLLADALGGANSLIGMLKSGTAGTRKDIKAGRLPRVNDLGIGGRGKGARSLFEGMSIGRFGTGVEGIFKEAGFVEKAEGISKNEAIVKTMQKYLAALEQAEALQKQFDAGMGGKKRTRPTLGGGEQDEKALKRLQQLRKASSDYRFESENLLKIESQQDELDRVRAEAAVSRLEIERRHLEMTKGITDATILRNAEAARAAQLMVVEIQEGQALGEVLDRQGEAQRRAAEAHTESAMALMEFAATKDPLAGLNDMIGITTDSFSQMFLEVFKGTKSAADAFRSMASSIIDSLGKIAIKAAAEGLIGLITSAFTGGAGAALSGAGALAKSGTGLGVGTSSLGAGIGYGDGAGKALTGMGSVKGLGGFGGFMAKGGRVGAGKGYVVGENGPEYFRPGQSGEIVPNDFLKQVMQQYGFFGMMIYPRLRQQRYGNQPMNAMEMRMFPRGFGALGGMMGSGMRESTGNPLLDISMGRGSFAGTQARAAGGPVLGGSGYTVGEKGPELFIPSGGGTMNANIVVNVSGNGGMQTEGEGNDNRRLGEAIGVAVRQELIRQKRPGGLLS